MTGPAHDLRDEAQHRATAHATAHGATHAAPLPSSTAASLAVPPPPLSVAELTVRRGPRTVLRRVSLALHAGEVLALVGPNGAGKSTLLRVMTGDFRHYDGAVTLLGRALRSWEADALARTRAVLPQESTLTFPFSATEVVMLGRTPHGGSAHPRAHAICAAALDAVGMAALADRLYTTLSGGERQRVQLARVLAQIWEPGESAARLLFLDEPIASLDLAQQHRALAVARRFAAQGVAVLVVLHDLNLAAQHADRVAVLREGELVAVDEPEAVLTPELVEQVFGIAVAVVPHPAGGRRVLVPLVGAGE